MRLLRSHFPLPLTIVNCNDNNWVESDYLLLGKINFYYLVDVCLRLQTKLEIDLINRNSHGLVLKLSVVVGFEIKTTQYPILE